MGSPYDSRRLLLEKLVDETEHVHVPPSFTGGLDEVVAAAAQHELEGVMAKRRDGVYQPGVRSRGWIKVKLNIERQTVIVGWLPDANGRVLHILIAVPTETGWRPVGKLIGGWTKHDAAYLTGRLTESEIGTHPTTGWRPVAPEIVIDVEFLEWTKHNKMRHPMWRGLRLGVKAADVEIE